LRRAAIASPFIFAAGPLGPLPPKLLGMPLVARISKRSTGLLYATLALFLTLSFTAVHAQPADAALYATGEKLFKGNCGACHKPDKDLTGPALKGARARWEGQGDIYAWIKNSSDYLKTGNAYANDLFNKWNKSVMTAQALTNEEIDAILYYADNYAPPAPKVADGGPVVPQGPNDAGDAWPWLVVLALLFVVVAMSLSGVKKGLANAVPHHGPEHPRVGLEQQGLREHHRPVLRGVHRAEALGRGLGHRGVRW
jgi:mono/diheme cytochrome c family protein